MNWFQRWQLLRTLRFILEWPVPVGVTRMITFDETGIQVELDSKTDSVDVFLPTACFRSEVLDALDTTAEELAIKSGGEINFTISSGEV